MTQNNFNPNLFQIKLFTAYYSLQRLGVVNMFDLKAVQFAFKIVRLNVSFDDIKYIQHNYDNFVNLLGGSNYLNKMHHNAISKCDNKFKS